MHYTPQLLAGLAAAAVGVTAQKISVPAVPTWPAGKCTDKSLSIPSWIISNYKVSATGTTSFGVSNRATDSRGSVTCAANGQCAVSGNGQLSAALSSSGGSASPVVRLEESWTCSDLGKVVNFNATGSTNIFSLQPSSDGGSASPITYLAYAGLSDPVPLTPAQPTPPPGYGLSSCADVSISPALYTVTDVTYKNYTKTQCRRFYGSICIDPVDTVYAGLYLNVTVKNEAIQHTLSCGLKLPSDPSAPLPNSPVRCSGGNFNELAFDVTWTGLAPHFNIAVEQLWYCLENPKTNVNPSVILAAGSTPLDLSCTSSPGITGQADDIVTICTQSSGTAAGIKGQTEDKQSQPAYSLVTAPPTSGGCTVTSVVKPEWTIRDPTFQTNYENSTTDQSLWLVGVHLIVPGYDHWFYGFIGERNLPGKENPETWYQCEWSVPGDWLPWACQFQYNYHTSTLGLDEIWECNEKDPAHPLYFHATGSVTFPSEGRRCANDNPNRNTCFYNGGWSKSWPVPHLTVGLTNVQPPRPH